MSDEIENIKAALKSSRVHITIGRQVFCDLVKSSGTTNEGFVRAAASLEYATDIPSVTVLSAQLSEMMGGQSDDDV